MHIHSVFNCTLSYDYLEPDTPIKQPEKARASPEKKLETPKKSSRKNSSLANTPLNDASNHVSLDICVVA